MNIAILVPVCSRKQIVEKLDDAPFVRFLFPSFLNTANLQHHYTFYIGIDSTDTAYRSLDFSSLVRENIEIKTLILRDCEHKPAFAWNQLFAYAYQQQHSYFYQIGDDIELLTPWVDTFIDILQKRDNIGVVGGCHDYNYNGRLQRGKPPVIENAFVHRKHFERFGTFFNKQIENWYCDDWITEVYKPNYSTICVQIKVANKIMDRYSIKDIGNKIQNIIQNDRQAFQAHGALTFTATAK